ncbi:DUF72 domain-containing protein [Glycomyces salinus]|uniref:DUF72 domain-containing protein n=1 Tax=Glycomyces salinus TaxID=980294 RepID=UPI0018ECEE5A|nr:DUF72 domain-containing protein [Glycomyces salinus]
MTVFVGTSGWQYKDWRGVLYPERLAQRRWLEHYSSRFATVENNGTFYRLPKPKTFTSWRSEVPEGFSMAVKASRFLTHIKRLKDPEEPVQRLMGAVDGLVDRLGPILLQLPPNLKADPDLLSACLDRFPERARVAVEARHESWWTDEVRSVLSDHDAALCWADTRSREQTPPWRTASWGYLRLHEGTAEPATQYGDRALNTWCGRLDDRLPKRADCYVYFNNDHGGAAIRNAFRFAELLRRRGREVPAAER